MFFVFYWELKSRGSELGFSIADTDFVSFEPNQNVGSGRDFAGILAPILAELLES